jgi:hypothetical protein
LNFGGTGSLDQLTANFRANTGISFGKWNCPNTTNSNR